MYGFLGVLGHLVEINIPLGFPVPAWLKEAEVEVHVCGSHSHSHIESRSQAYWN